MATSVVIASFWEDTEPKKWTPAPPQLSYSVAKEIETCPLRWALLTAVFDSHAATSYPRPVNQPALDGQVIHIAIDTLVKYMRDLQRKRRDLDDYWIAAVLELGGLRQIVLSAIDVVETRLRENPRIASTLEYFIDMAREKASELREQLQMQLFRLRSLSAPSATLPDEGSPTSAFRGLFPGLHSEVLLHSEQLGWKGVADLLVLSEEGCELVDFKTGAADPAHIEQIELYSILWKDDAAMNPTARPITSMTISYGIHAVSVSPLSPSDEARRRENLVGRSAKIRNLISGSDSEARPSTENCERCPVRHMCSPFWASTISRPALEKSFPRTDLQVLLGANRTPGTWDATVQGSSSATSKSVLICAAPIHRSRLMDLPNGTVLRFLGCTLQVDNPDIVPLVIANPFTEIFSVHQA